MFIEFRLVAKDVAIVKKELWCSGSNYLKEQFHEKHFSNCDSRGIVLCPGVTNVSVVMFIVYCLL